MKTKIEVEDGLTKEEIVIRCQSLSKDVIFIQKRITDALNSRMQLDVSKGEKEYYVTIDEILFSRQIPMGVVHTATHIYETKYRLYELENLLPGNFVRVADFFLNDF